MKLLTKIVAVLVVAVLIAGLAGFFFLPPILKNVLTEKLSQALHRPVTIGEIKINPWELSATVKGLAIKDAAKDAPFVSFDELYINCEGLSSLAQRAVVLKEIRLSHPNMHIDRHADGSFNFSDLIPKEEAKPKPAATGKPLLFSVRNLKIIDGNVTCNDEPNKKNHAIDGMNLSLPFISNMDRDNDVFVEPQFSAKVNGSPLQIAGRVKPFLPSREAHATVDIVNLDVPFYMPYIPVKLNGRVVSALVAAKLKVDFLMRKDKSPHLLLTGSADLKDIALDDPGKNKILRLPAAHIVLKSVLPLDENIHLSLVAVEKPEIVVKRGKDGKINLLGILPKNDKKSTWKTRIDELVIHAAKVDFRDAVPPTPVGMLISPLDVKMQNLSTKKGEAGTCDLSLILTDKRGAITAHGPVVIDPLKADLAIDIKDVTIRTFQSYFNEKVKINVTRGFLSSKGNVFLSMDGRGEPKATFEGVFFVSEFASVDKAQADPFLNWKLLYFDGVHFGYNPFYLNIKGISMTDYYARIILRPDGKLNLQDILVEEGQKKKTDAGPVEKKSQTAKAKEPPLKVNVGKVTLQGGTINFTDLFIKPNYSARMLNMSGSVLGLSSMESSRATVNMKGNLGYGSPIEITGKINPLIKDLFADIKLSFKTIELSPMTPYAAKFLGYPILKGKLTYDAAYLIDKRTLNATNKVFIDQLTLGDRVEGPDALKLPVKLAVTLLKDRNGHINLDIPVSGSLDDPKFKVWPIVWQVIKNLFTKAATAPFALLASLTGSGEEMGYVEFEYGSASVSEANIRKVNALVKVLTDKPGLKMDIEGRVDGENDRTGLKAAELMRKVKAQKLNAMIKMGGHALPVEQIQVQPQEYEKYLTQAYHAAPFPKQRTVEGSQKSLSLQDIEKLMLTHIEATDSDLRQLAARRAEKVKELILSSGAVAPDRIFIIESGGTPPEKKEKVKDSRVDLKLK
ncbi:MAG: DUF748 domain-containing protein [Deltaproteobacteria bacterium]|nr:DUF748 domain-containing protein [Deltaproteobacteria bacterium]